MDYLVHIFRLNEEDRAVIYFLSAMQNNELLQRCLREFGADLGLFAPALGLTPRVVASGMQT